MFNPTRLALAAMAAGATFAIGAVATATPADARYGLHRGFGAGHGVYGHRPGMFRHSARGDRPTSHGQPPRRYGFTARLVIVPRCVRIIRYDASGNRYIVLECR